MASVIGHCVLGATLGKLLPHFSRMLLAGLGLAVSAPVVARSAPPAHAVFLLGNMATAELPTRHLQALRRTRKQQTGPFTVVHLGDITGNNGLLGSAKDFSQAGQTARTDALIALVQGLPNGRIYFLPADKDWANSGPDGLKRVRRLDKYTE
jgi:hypothetical protein